VNFNLAYLDTSLDEFHGNIATLTHEIMHVLGFDETLYDQFIDEKGLLMPITKVR